MVSQLNNDTLAPVAEEHISEAAGVNSAAGNFGLSFGLALAALLGLFNSLRMMRLPDLRPSESLDGIDLG